MECMHGSLLQSMCFQIGCSLEVRVETGDSPFILGQDTTGLLGFGSKDHQRCSKGGWELFSFKNLSHYFKEWVTHDIPAFFVKQTWYSIRSWSSTKVRFTYGFPDVFFCWWREEHLIVFICEYRLYFIQEYFLRLMVEGCRIQKQIFDCSLKISGTVCVTFYYSVLCLKFQN